jgi:hypothetical protein
MSVPLVQAFTILVVLVVGKSVFSVAMLQNFSFCKIVDATDREVLQLAFEEENLLFVQTFLLIMPPSHVVFIVIAVRHERHRFGLRSLRLVVVQPSLTGFL